jgi:hypothetical protein
MHGVRLQEWIHRLEEGAGARYLRRFLVVAAFLGLAALYDAFFFRSFQNAEAMEAAQLARNLGEGQGFTTEVVRPFSIFLVRKKTAEGDPKLKAHPDTSTAPLYPLLLAPVLRASSPGTMTKGGLYLPELHITFLNQMFLGLSALLVFVLARTWFNQTVAWLSVALFLLTELNWRFSISGLSTTWLTLLVLCLVWILVRFEAAARAGASAGKTALLAALAGLFCAAIFLTRYSAGWLVLPVLLFVLASAKSARWIPASLVLVAFLGASTPWVARNMAVSGFPFGTATFAPLQETYIFPADTLERSLAPSFSGLPGHHWTLFGAVVRKGVANFREVVAHDFPRMGGSWIWALFIAGLLVRFQNPALRRARWLILGSLALFGVIQAFVRTHVATESPIVNSENLLVLLAPLVLIFGVGMFAVLFDSWEISSLGARSMAMTAFVFLASLPLVLALLPPRGGNASSPYYPARIQQIASYTNEREMLMSDIPWAVAWYGDRQCLWLTANWRKDFFEVNDFLKPVSGLFMSTRTTDTKFLSNWHAGPNQGWGRFLLFTFSRGEIPDGFPLKRAPEGVFAHGELLLMDRDRWNSSQANTRK